jgi:membrane protease YdiL (CAAX protease family)
MAGLTVNAIAGFGEELGWRGLLLRETAPFGFWNSSFLIGAIWGIWYLPFIIHGHNYPGYPIAGIFMMILWTILFSPLIGYVCIRSSSVLSAVIMHGALNGTAMAPAVLIKGGNSLQVGVMGIAGMSVLLILNLILFGFGKPEEAHKKWAGNRFDCAKN